jgi:nucleotide-binding universal stress UspA family protein
MPGQTPTLIICYDGSDRAKHAIEVAAKLFPGAPAKILHVWEPIEHIVARYAALAPYLGESTDDADAGFERESESVAQEGAELAKAAGLDASAHTAILENSVWQSVLEAGGRLDGELIVTGTRSLRGAHELLVGTLSHALLQHGHIPLLAVPAAE